MKVCIVSPVPVEARIRFWRVADCYLFVILLWAMKFSVPTPDALLTLRGSMLGRPAVRRAMEREGLRIPLAEGSAQKRAGVRVMASAPRDASERRGVVAWIEKRFPLRALIESQLRGYYAPKNFNFWYYFGVLALVLLVSPFATGIVLAMFNKPGKATAFDSVEYIMREVPWGWLIRYVHSTGAGDQRQVGCRQVG
jgi:Cytochrome b/b6/petB